jgi:hypothetical protein
MRATNSNSTRGLEVVGRPQSANNRSADGRVGFQKAHANLQAVMVISVSRDVLASD